MRQLALRYFNSCGAWGGSGEKHNPETHLIPLILQVPLVKREKLYRDTYSAQNRIIAKQIFKIYLI